ncbi:hypothetical protein KY284_007753 [Solanum tuberosum]|nr:hypothetical protein KY284_007753 [Solanum tuberosum]
MQSVMDTLIDPSQAAFVPGRVIVDNILLSHELVKGYGRIVSYSILINGVLDTPFKAKKGLRQGDLVSPYLFVLSMEYLSRLMKNLKWIREFKYHPKCSKVNIVQLGFDDDLLLFSRDDAKFVQVLFDTFQEFSKASGLIANTIKSSIYFGGVRSTEQDQIMAYTGFTKGEMLFRYLGVPLSTKRLSIAQCEPLLEKMLGRVSSWTSKFLSYAGKA